MIEEAARDGGYRLVPGCPDDTANPSLFMGIAGIGYELLRLAYPELLESVLLFQ
jgi:lantibiotic modifying enzyme